MIGEREAIVLENRGKIETRGVGEKKGSNEVMNGQTNSIARRTCEYSKRLPGESTDFSDLIFIKSIL